MQQKIKGAQWFACTKCGQNKRGYNFEPDIWARDGYYPWCKTCCVCYLPTWALQQIPNIKNRYEIKN